MFFILIMLSTIRGIKDDSTKEDIGLENRKVEVMLKQSYASTYDVEFYMIVRDVNTDSTFLLRHVPMKYYSKIKVGDIL